MSNQQALQFINTLSAIVYVLLPHLTGLLQTAFKLEYCTVYNCYIANRLTVFVFI